jgi:hypothetical protein
VLEALLDSQIHALVITRQVCRGPARVVYEVRGQTAQKYFFGITAHLVLKHVHVRACRVGVLQQRVRGRLHLAPTPPPPSVPIYANDRH